MMNDVQHVLPRATLFYVQANDRNKEQGHKEKMLLPIREQNFGLMMATE
jgi:hypothetical protein